MADEPTTTTPTASAAAPAADPAPASAAEPSSILSDAGAAPAADGAQPAAEPAKPEPPAGAPEKYEFKAPDGFEIKPEDLTGFEGIARELNLTQEAAQKLMDFEAARLKPLLEAPFQQWAEQNSRWQAEVKADTEIGGAKFDASVAEAGTALDRLPELAKQVGITIDAAALRKGLADTGAGNVPAVVKAFVALGKLIGEDNGIAPTPRPAAERPTTLEGIGRRMYPSMANG